MTINIFKEQWPWQENEYDSKCMFIQGTMIMTKKCIQETMTTTGNVFNEQ